MVCIDFHAHAFPDALAESTIPALEARGNVTAALDGKLSTLLASMDRAGVDKSVVCSIATRPSHFRAILDWSEAIRSERIIPFPSCHPESPRALAEIDEIRQRGFKGIKMHPYYQDFFLNEERLRPLFARIADLGLILVMHTGYDIGFPRTRRADPAAIAALQGSLPHLKMIATHLGAWDQWDEVEREISGKEIYLDIAFSLEYLEPARARELILAHPGERILFGSDSPWADPGETMRRLQELELDPELEKKILGGNGAALLAGA